jgi:Zn-dependent protease
MSACPTCAEPLSPELLACPACGALRWRTRLEELFATSRAAEAAGDLPGALRALLECIPLLPSATQQARHLQSEIQRLTHLYNHQRPALDPEKLQAPQTEALTSVSFIRAVLVALRWSAQGLLRPATLISLIIWTVSLSFLMGWRMALLFGLCIYVHEMGHLVAIRYFGFRFAWPVFIPFFGAFVLQGRESARRLESVVIALAGPLAGSCVSFALLGLNFLTPLPQSLQRLAYINLLVNALNLLPVWQLDGNRIARQLRRAELLLLAGLLTLLALLQPNWFGLLFAIAWALPCLILPRAPRTPAPVERIRLPYALLTLLLLISVYCLKVFNPAQPL